MAPSDADRVRFVLVEPSHPGNIGAAARAIKTMGFGRLAVVAPRESAFKTNEDALAFATHGADVLRSALVYERLAQALDDVRLAFAMTGYAREFGAPLFDLRAAATRAEAQLQAGPGAVAFVFSTAGGVLFAKAMNLALPERLKVNPCIRAAGVSAVPMAARVVQTFVSNATGGKVNLLMPAMGPNVAGVIGTAVAAGAFIAMLR